VQQQESWDVIVSGAGPVGLFLAAELRRFGLDVVVLELLEQTSAQIKAGSVGSGSAELFDQRGLLDQFPRPDLSIFAGVSGDGPPRPVGHFAGLWLLRGDPQIRTLPIFAQQQDVEIVLERHARAAGVVIWREHELISFTDETRSDETRSGETRSGETRSGETRSGENRSGETRAGGPGAGRGAAARGSDYPVRVTAAHGGGTVELAARYLVGCDGGRSRVRKLAGFDFPGTSATVTGRQAIAGIAEPNPLQRGWHRTDRGMVVYGPDPRRVLTVEFDGPPADRSAPLSQDELEASLRRVSGADVTLTDLATGTRWTDNTRQVPDYQRGRVLLAGDAAHVHPPFGGQGLNLGLQDAANLGWKLAAAIAGSAPGGLLGTYTAERHPVAAAALANTRAQVALMRPDPQSSALRELFTELMTYDDANQHVSRLMAGVDQPYPVAGSDPQAGRMAADCRVDTAGGAGRLYELLRTPGALLVDGSPDASWSQAAAAAGIRAVRAPGGGSLLVRPDGIVAWGAPAGSRAAGSPAAAELSAALAQWFGEPVRPGAVDDCPRPPARLDPPESPRRLARSRSC
jgi:2-polyprenyl-6-methoxyphenol hydroxylase-like FAD-dependent oxidoreductase